MISAVRKESFTDFMHSLYMSAFSDIERIPYANIERTLDRGGEILSLEDGGPVGMMYSFIRDDVVFLVYFAIDERYRSKGYGSQALDALRRIHSDKRIFIVIEPMDGSEERKRRFAFYLRNGCKDMDMEVISDDAPFDAMTIQGDVSEQEIRDSVAYYEMIHNGGKVRQ